PSAARSVAAAPGRGDAATARCPGAAAGPRRAVAAPGPGAQARRPAAARPGWRAGLPCPKCGIHPRQVPAARTTNARPGSGGGEAGSRRLGVLVALEAADVLDINAVADHLELAGRQLQGGGVGRGEVEAAALQALVPDAWAVAVPGEDLEPVGLAIE